VERIVTATEADTAAVGRRLALTLEPGTVVLLEGDLGAGKTAFVRGMAEGFGLDPADVTSPTFTIVQEYRGPSVTLQHVDLYRLSPAEVADLALDDLLDDRSVMAIEWAGHLPRPPGDAVVRVTLAHAPDSRIITIDR
jgi:tRNA threonylcarbamoyladenosine biosynthesis protein TsaE